MINCFILFPLIICGIHLSNLQLADPGFAHPGSIDFLLVVDVFIKALLPGQYVGLADSPAGLETESGMVLAWRTDSCTPIDHVTSHHISLISANDQLPRFWLIQVNPPGDLTYSLEEHSIIQHFKDNNIRTDS